MTTYLMLLLLMAIADRPPQMEMGLVQIESRSNYSIQFYKTAQDTAAVHTIQMVFDTFSFSMRDRDEVLTWFRPEAYWPEYMPLTMRCRSKTKDRMEVVVNKETNETLWIKNNALVKYLTWPEYLQNMYAIDRSDPATNPIHIQPDTLSPILEYTGRDFFSVDSISGDWMKISTPIYADSDDIKIRIQAGWIRWRDGNKILITYYPTA
jgi:hypothetical protein